MRIVLRLVQTWGSHWQVCSPTGAILLRDTLRALKGAMTSANACGFM